MNDLSNAAVSEHQTSFSCKPIPSLALFILVPLFLIGLFVSVFILVVVHNAAFLLSFLLLFALVSSFLAWNAVNWRHHNRSAFAIFINSLPDSDLRLAREGQLVKITGVASCGSLSLETSYERVARCIYASTLLYEYGQFGLKPVNVKRSWFQWNLAYCEILRVRTNYKVSSISPVFVSVPIDTAYCARFILHAEENLNCEMQLNLKIDLRILLPSNSMIIRAYSKRFSTDFYITDRKSGISAVVKAGSGCKVIPLIIESKLVTTTNQCRALSPHLSNWLRERNLSGDARLLRLEEGYVQEGNTVTVIGMLQKVDDVLMIVQTPELISTGCLWQRLLLPVDVDGLILAPGGS